jgi:3-dehydroquinate dehydratase
LAQIEEAACTTQRASASTDLPSVESRRQISNIHIRDKHHRHSTIRRSRPALFAHGHTEAMHALAQLAKKSRSEPTRITPNEWASVLSLLLLVHFRVSG